MIYFRSLTSSDRVTLEGREVKRTFPIIDRKTKQITHYGLVVVDADGEATQRKFRAEEIPHLIESELLVIDRGYYSVARQTDRALYGDREVHGASKKQRARIDHVTFLARRMGHYRALGMKLTRDGVHVFHQALREDDLTYQSLILYGTQKPNSTQNLKPLPSEDTLLGYYRKFRRAAKDPRVYLPPRRRPVDLDHQRALDDLFVLRILYEFAAGTVPSKTEVAEKAVERVTVENERRIAAGYPAPMKVLTAGTYARWIDKRLDPFAAKVARDGLGPARKEFGSVEKIETVSLPGEQVQFDAWNLHVVSLDTTRERWLLMTEEQRRKVKRVRRWIVVAIDVATRVILGFALCRNPNQAASLEALRMCFMDKTPLLRDSRLTKSVWHHRAPIALVVTDSGSEFGKHPFGGAEFGEAVRLLSGSLMNTTAGVPELRAYIERFFLTLDLKWARHQPGWTASNPQKRNDRKPYEEACLTDDELYRQMIAFIADYNTTSHRGVNQFTPAGMWEKLTQDFRFDPSQLPGPKALREACGLYRDATISEDGIRFENVAYSNEFIRNQRTALGVDRIDKSGRKIEIKVDPMDLGAISVLTGEDVISVPAVDSAMLGKTLAQWRQERTQRRADAQADVEAHAEARKEARARWKSESEAIAKSADVDVRGLSLAEISRSAMELSFGKGHHEKPFIGRDEYADPAWGGFTLSGEDGSEERDADSRSIDTVEADPNEVEPDAPNAMDRFRSKVQSRSGGKSWKGNK